MRVEWQYISSKSNALIIRIAKLKDKKYRKNEELFRFDGIKLFLEAAQNGVPIRYVFVSESAVDRFKNEVEQSNVCAMLYIVSDDALILGKIQDVCAEMIFKGCKNEKSWHS